MPSRTFFKLSEEKKKKIVDAALEEFLCYKDNYSKASVNRIADKAGIAVGSLYKYFRDKNEIFLYVYDQFVIQDEPQNNSGSLKSYFLEKIKKFSEQEKDEICIEKEILFGIALKNKSELLYPMFFDTENFFLSEKIERYLKCDKKQNTLNEQIDTELAAYLYLALDFLALNYCEMKNLETDREHEILLKLADIFFYGIYKS